MTELEKVEQDLVKDVMKFAVINNPNLTSAQKQKALDDIEIAATRTNLVLEYIDFLNRLN